MALTDFDFVLFGGGGDLAMRKLIPALYALSRGKGFPQGGRIIAVGRHEWSREAYLEELDKQAKPNIEEERLDEAAWKAFCDRVDYVSLNATDASTTNDHHEHAAPTAVVQPHDDGSEEYCHYYHGGDDD